MSSLAWLSLLTVGALTLLYFRFSLVTATLIAGGGVALLQLYDGFSLLPWLCLALVTIPLNLKPLRRRLVSGPVMAWFAKVLPPMSATEKEAIDAGTVWWDGDLFTGRPDWDKLLAHPAPRISEEEQAFIDGPVEELCRMLDDWQIHERNAIPPEGWDCLKQHGFLGLLIPKEYGGLGCSARAQSEVVMKIATRSGTAAVSVMVPNSLGPGELLAHYGTEEQKRYYLPRLARGEEIPAFALTGPYAGSDAASMPDVGVVCRGEYQGREVLGFRTNWDKRYITLGPIATVLGLAFRARDPQGLLGGAEELGITCALIPCDTPGLSIGRRHKPGSAFQNGPNTGENVFIPMDWVIGGQEQLGKGWRMLMDCLAAGRAISLPALGTGSAKLCSRMTGAYARIRKQFRTPIGKFEGVEEALTRIGGLTYRIDAARSITAGAIDQGEKPAVLSAILKYHATESMRQVAADALDVHGGRGVCDGPRNYLQPAWRNGSGRQHSHPQQDLLRAGRQSLPALGAGRDAGGR